MDAAELRAMQAPIKERYKQDPSAAVITLKAKGSIETEGLTCKVETGRALAIAGLHPATGGSGLELCSGDMLLEALVACAGVTLKSVATVAAAYRRLGERMNPPVWHPAEPQLGKKSRLGFPPATATLLSRVYSLMVSAPGKVTSADFIGSSPLKPTTLSFPKKVKVTATSCFNLPESFTSLCASRS